MMLILFLSSGMILRKTPSKRRVKNPSRIAYNISRLVAYSVNKPFVITFRDICTRQEFIDLVRKTFEVFEFIVEISSSCLNDKITVGILSIDDGRTGGF